MPEQVTIILSILAVDLVVGEVCQQATQIAQPGCHLGHLRKHTADEPGAEKPKNKRNLEAIRQIMFPGQWAVVGRKHLRTHRESDARRECPAPLYSYPTQTQAHEIA